jgi:hypothetical protein
MTHVEAVTMRSEFERVSKNKIKASALITASNVREIPVADSKDTMDIVPEETHYKWHADIVNWPNTKDECKLLAIELANAAKLEKLSG